MIRHLASVMGLGLAVASMGCVVERAPHRRPVVVAPPAVVVAPAPVVVAPAPPGAEGMAVVVASIPPAPPPRVEVVTVQPSPAHVWIGGHWGWRGREYVWVPGYWATPISPRHGWVPGRWVERPGGYAWVEGHWRPR